MRMAFWKHLTVLAVLGTGMIAPAVQAAQFEQQEIDQSRFIILAAPGGELGYKLLILEQIKSNRPCWSETGGSPSSVDPLLLKFDFTGICSRTVDSNGFSVRAAGQDEALDYSLRIVPQDNDMVLVAASNSKRNSLVEIGRTNGLPSGFSRINLNPGWRLTRRAFNGRAVGHLYLTYDQPIEMLATSDLRRAADIPANIPAPALSPAPATPDPTIPGVIPVPSLPPGLTLPAAPPAAPPTGDVPVTGSSAPLLQPSTPPTSPSLSTLLPPPPPSGISAAPSVAPSASPALLPRPAPSAVGGISSASSPLPAASLPTPAVPTAATAQPVATAQPAQSDIFQVIVEADSAEMQDKVRAIAPSALLTTINGQVVMQVGIFRDRQEADRLQQRLSQEGLPTAVIPVR